MNTIRDARAARQGFTLRPVQVEPQPSSRAVFSVHRADGRHVGDIEEWGATGHYPYVVWTADRCKAMSYRRYDAALRWLAKQAITTEERTQ